MEFYFCWRLGIFSKNFHRVDIIFYTLIASVYVLFVDGVPGGSAFDSLELHK